MGLATELQIPCPAFLQRETDSMEACIITVGDEILIGETVDTNSAWIAQQLNLLGISVKQILSVSDAETDIHRAIDFCKPQCALMLMTGGLGPTRDDKTKHALCNYFNSSLEIREEFLEDVKRIFSLRGLPLLDTNRQQAALPKSCTGIRNPHGTAPGMRFEWDGKMLVSLPGVPYEMKAMMSEHVLPLLGKKFGNTSLVHRHVLSCGIGESFLAERIKEWELALPPHIRLAYLPSPGRVKLRLTANGKNTAKLRDEVEDQIAALKLLCDEHIYGYDEETLQGNIGKLLQQKQLQLVTAESCTGGYIAHELTTTPRSSSYFKGAVIAYSNEVKTGLLHVHPQAIESFGAVSEAVALQMHHGVLKALQGDVAIAVTGVAGPDGGSEDKPVGTVWIAVGSYEKAVVKKFFFPVNDRLRVIQLSSTTALNRLRLFLQNRLKD
jgi:nicotinamide-nucleotide amidase